MGVLCEPCDQRWWSWTFTKAAHKAEEEAVAHVIENLLFPPDAVTEEDRRKEIADKYPTKDGS